MKSARIRLGMVGGGRNGFIGGVHRFAARLDDEYELVAGALSSDPVRAKVSGDDLGIAADRVYTDFREMARAEATRPDGIQAVSVVTPNALHVPVARAFLDAGIHVICDKPLAISLDEALSLRSSVAESGRVFVLTHNYSAYPMVRLARQMVERGEIGRIQTLQVEYLQDWLATAVEVDGNAGAAWRTDPDTAGQGGAIGDIGTHAFHLMRFVTGLVPQSLSARLSTFVEGRRVDDDAQVMMSFDGGAHGFLWASQVAPGHANSLRLRVYGNAGMIDWSQERPEELTFARLGEAPRLLRRGHADAEQADSRIPGGHPEGYLEAFATIYREAADAIHKQHSGIVIGDTLSPGLSDGIEGMAFIECALASSRNGGIPTTLSLPSP
ncbi:Gfo/Idh/MocA family oxidoreductase [Salipiger sp. 1_MG-2023]|uniref:Gfo/Idh/MocA family protein n=1 Tax=Salipiger sp. 1_MG-2023 TaxID=3062665 RepID=UPI0026E447B8|nr:Gfo/Idh/MocA family oxidoreductase [Salipiger sp. 1_MG-2023]MDO6588311.1 Gfo/Idh/MocA family oxidoreductase [Salipiger sp. 1_MG-2023]